MNSRILASGLVCLGVVCWAPPITRAQFIFQTSPNALIPDYPAMGIASSINVSVPWTSVEGVEVRLNIAGTGLEGQAFNGDYYVYLTHTDSLNRVGLAVLLNRVGRDAGNPTGYGDNGFDVTFTDDAGFADVHSYRLTLSGNPNQALPNPGVLTGIWQPDGRETDPAAAVASDARTAGLSQFVGLDPAGLWTIYAQDFSLGGDARLVSWSLVLVPEPASTAVFVGLGLLVWRGLRRRGHGHAGKMPALLS
ncbi:MAG: hypothetical protein FJ387_11275 [Verrucomicrobia bacterium]|nr:hypothetical protein [Verrucomicrobiota bacterium]